MLGLHHHKNGNACDLQFYLTASATPLDYEDFPAIEPARVAPTPSEQSLEFNNEPQYGKYLQTMSMMPTEGEESMK
jgi:hypothetical protein